MPPWGERTEVTGGRCGVPLGRRSGLQERAAPRGGYAPTREVLMGVEVPRRGLGAVWPPAQSSRTPSSSGSAWWSGVTQGEGGRPTLQDVARRCDHQTRPHLGPVGPIVWDSRGDARTGHTSHDD